MDANLDIALTFELDGVKYDWSPRHLGYKELEVIEQETGLGLGDIFDGLKHMRLSAMKAIVWSAKRHAGEITRWKDVRFDPFALLMSIHELSDIQKTEDDEEGDEEERPTAPPSTSNGSSDGTSPETASSGTLPSSPESFTSLPGTSTSSP